MTMLKHAPPTLAVGQAVSTALRQIVSMCIPKIESRWIPLGGDVADPYNYVPPGWSFWVKRYEKNGQRVPRLSRSLKVIVTDTDRSATATYNFLLGVHSNHSPISYCFRDKRRFPSKFSNFHTLSTLCPKKTVVPNFGDNFVKS